MNNNPNPESQPITVSNSTAKRTRGVAEYRQVVALERIAKALEMQFLVNNSQYSASGQIKAYCKEIA